MAIGPQSAVTESQIIDKNDISPLHDGKYLSLSFQLGLVAFLFVYTLGMLYRPCRGWFVEMQDRMADPEILAWDNRRQLVNDAQANRLQQTDELRQ